jgi:4-hydroxybenzoate polyprenyltransferase
MTSAFPGTATTAHTARDSVPLVVDLDDTLVRTDLLLESLFVLAKRSPARLLLVPVWLAKGKAHLKRRLAQIAMPDVTVLPYRQDLLNRLQAERRHGRQLVLATAADKALAEEVAQHLGLFDTVLASDGTVNLARECKRDCLVGAYGAKGFDYVGSGRSDLVVWRAARKALVVQTRRRLAARIAEITDVETIAGGDPPRLGSYLAALRPHQWLKNALIFLPLLATRRIYDVDLLWQGLLVFAAFSLCASSAYLLNDLLDLSNDRRHPCKRNRPFASGQVPLLHGLVLAPLLLLLGLVVGAVLSFVLLGVLALYYSLTMSYSLRLKDLVIVDVLALAGLYTLRVLAGAAAFDIAPSPWLLAFCVFLFFSLAMVKRYVELVAMRPVEGAKAHARAYLLEDRELLAALGGASGYLSVLVLALYITNDAMHDPHVRYQLIWLVCVLLLHWVSYMWLMAHRARMLDDPLVFALRDRTSQVVIALMAACLLIAA